MSFLESQAHQPVKNTYILRIHSSHGPMPGLPHPEQYRRVVDYTFDDNDANYHSGPMTITNDIADIIVKDFADHRSWIESLIVHCTKGKNRSPAVAIALNEIFELGHDSSELKRIYKEANGDVYRAILAAGQRNKSYFKRRSKK